MGGLGPYPQSPGWKFGTDCQEKKERGEGREKIDKKQSILINILDVTSCIS